jgi:hypothetical protein
LNAEHGLNYEFVFSPQVKDERYLYIYNPERVLLEDYALVEDPGDRSPICDSSPESTGLMVRQPFKAEFRAGEFDFVLLTAHTSPSRNLQELEGLEFFYRETEAEGEPDVIILGDLNADCGYLKPTDFISLREPDYIWVVGDGCDTTVSGTVCADPQPPSKIQTIQNHSPIQYPEHPLVQNPDHVRPKSTSHRFR